jgi:hypothetical protein
MARVLVPVVRDLLRARRTVRGASTAPAVVNEPAG